MTDISKQRLDVALVERGLAKSREKAKALISEGFVTVNGKTADKASKEILDTDAVLLTGELAYVGRGGKKLEKALSAFNVSPEGKICLDIGASTGGFTDCMLRNGAKLVYAVDVGSGQLDPDLAADPAVINMEKTDVRVLDASALSGGLPGLVTIDVSFISLTKILPCLKGIMGEDADVLALLKPQFEAGKTKKGIVSSPDIHTEVIENILTFAALNGFCVMGLDHSPVKGGDGNIEFLLHLRMGDKGREYTRRDIKEAVKNAHAALKKH